MDFYNQDFWKALDRLVEESEIIIDRPKGSRHPKYHNLRYEVDYGYLKGTSSMDGHGIDLWRGTKENPMLDAIICTSTYLKRTWKLSCCWVAPRVKKRSFIGFIIRISI